MQVPYLPVLLLPLCLSAVDTPVGWRGDGTGVFPGQKPPSEWSDEKNILWRAPMPNWSNSSPVVADGRVYVTSEIREAFPELLCFDAATGKEQWRVALDPLKDDGVRKQWTEVNLVMREMLELRGERLWIAETNPADAEARLADLAKRAAAAQVSWKTAR